MTKMIIGISGPSASGKSLLSNTIVNELGSNQVVVISEDSYYKNQPHLKMEERAETNYDHPNSLDHDLLYQHLKELQKGKTVEIPLYDHSKHARRADTKTIRKHEITVIEGILLFVNTKLRDIMDMKIFMDIPLDMCLSRRLKRDVLERNRTFTSVLSQYEKTVRPMYLQFIEPCKQYANIIVPHGGTNRIAIDIIKTHIKGLLDGN